MQSTPPISGLVLAGGHGRRLGHADKGLQALGGRPVISHVIERLAPQVTELIISANRHIGDYALLGQAAFKDARVVGDTLGSGPLAGLYSGLQAATRNLLVMVPCDAPGLPADLVARLWSALSATNAQLAVVTTGGRVQPVFALVRRSVLQPLSAYLDSGGRKADGWYEGLYMASVAFDDEAGAFANLNTPEDFSSYAPSPASAAP